MKKDNVLKQEECYILNNGVQIPAIAFGTYKAADGKNADVIRMAIEAGYRYFDTASFYETETYLAEAIRESGRSRDEFFIASKLWKTEMGYENVKRAFSRTLENLETDYLDLYLIQPAGLSGRDERPADIFVFDEPDGVRNPCLLTVTKGRVET